jgi:2'-5' RNA ligase
MLPGDRLIVAFLEEHTEGHTFEDWPLHITIVPWFRNEVPTEDISIGLRGVLQSIVPFDIRTGEAANFGRNGQKAVELVRTPTPLMAIERLVRRYLHRQGSWIVDETTRVQRSFRPHITRQATEQAKPQQQFYIPILCIVEQRGDYKEITAVIHLGQLSH